MQLKLSFIVLLGWLVGSSGALFAASKPSLSFDRASATFANTIVNYAPTQAITLTNSGNAAAASVTYSIDSPFAFVSNGCGTSISVGETCSFTISFKPPSVGSFSEKLIVTYKGGQVSLTLTGNGVASGTTTGGGGGGTSGSGKLVLGATMPNFGQGSTAAYVSQFGAQPHVVGMTWPLLASATQGTVFPCSTVKAVTTPSTIVMMTLLPAISGSSGPTNAEITEGNYNAALIQWAQGIASCGVPILLRFAHEMNGNWYPWSPGVNGNPANGSSYQAMWKYVWTLFRTYGANANLVKWIFCVNVGNYTPIANVYPGNSYVDILAADGYNWDINADGGVRSFTTIFSTTYAQLAALSTTAPMMVAETGCSEEQGDAARAAWLTSALGTEIPKSFPRFTTVVYFNEPASGQDWELPAGSESSAAFAAQAQSALWNNVFP